MEEEQQRIYTCKIDADSKKFIEAFLFVEAWKLEKLEDGTRNESKLRAYPASFGFYQKILNDISKIMRFMGGELGYRTTRQLKKENIYFFGAWNDKGWLQGMAMATNIMVPDGCSHNPEAALTIDSLCVGPGRFMDDEPTPPKGTGASLLKHIVCWAKDHLKVETIILDTTAQSKSFYLKFGFEPREKWHPSNAVCWLELHDSEGRWDKVQSLDKYDHVMCASCDRVPPIADINCPLLIREIGPPLDVVLLTLKIKCLLTYIEGKGIVCRDPFGCKLLSLISM